VCSRPDGGLRGEGHRGAIRNRKYGWPEEGYDMDMARRQFQNDLTVAGKSVYDSRELTKIIDDVYEEISDDGYSTQNDFFDELEKRIVMYLNQCFAMNKEGSKCMYVEKMISIEYGTPTFEFRNEASVKMFLESATKNRGYEWPPPSHSTNIPSTGSGNKKKDSKNMIISPFAIWKNCDKRLWFIKVERCPYTTDPKILNSWIPNVITRERAAGCAKKTLHHDDGTTTSIHTVINYVRQVFCGESDNILNWLLDWMATVIQRPGVPTKIAPLLTGEEGNGKNFFFDMFAAILGPPHHTVISATRIFDRFNGSVEGKSLVFVNEMDTLTKKEMASVNILITDPTASIERKGQERREVKNVANFVFVSNVLHRDLFPDFGTTKRRFVHLSSRNVNKNPVLWSHFWEWSGGNMIDPTGKNPENSSTTRKICNGSLALADFLYNRKVTRRIDEIQYMKVVQAVCFEAFKMYPNGGRTVLLEELF